MGPKRLTLKKLPDLSGAPARMPSTPAGIPDRFSTGVRPASSAALVYSRKCKLPLAVNFFTPCRSQSRKRNEARALICCTHGFGFLRGSHGPWKARHYVRWTDEVIGDGGRHCGKGNLGFSAAGQRRAFSRSGTCWPAPPLQISSH